MSFYAPRCPAPAAPATATTAGGAALPAESAHTAAATSPKAAGFSVQVLAVKSAPQVDEMLTRLKAMGFDAHVVRDDSTGFFKVRVGRYATHDEAARAQARLRTRIGGQPFVVEEP